MMITRSVDKKRQGLYCSCMNKQLLPHYVFVMYLQIDVNRKSTITMFDSDSTYDRGSFDIDYCANSQTNYNINAIETPLTATLALSPQDCQYSHLLHHTSQDFVILVQVQLIHYLIFFEYFYLWQLVDCLIISVVCCGVVF